MRIFLFYYLFKSILFFTHFPKIAQLTWDQSIHCASHPLSFDKLAILISILFFQSYLCNVESLTLWLIPFKSYNLKINKNITYVDCNVFQNLHNGLHSNLYHLKFAKHFLVHISVMCLQFSKFGIWKRIKHVWMINAINGITQGNFMLQRTHKDRILHSIAESKDWAKSYASLNKTQWMHSKYMVDLFVWNDPRQTIDRNAKFRAFGDWITNGKYWV